jgi:hypothetical protein
MTVTTTTKSTPPLPASSVAVRRRGPSVHKRSADVLISDARPHFS